MADPVVIAGGVVLLRHGADGVEVALIHRPRRDDWTFPKGKAEPGEPLPVTAAREALEETGFEVRLGAPLPMQRYLVGGIVKEVSYWLARDMAGSFVANDEVDVMRWVPVDIGRAALTYPRDGEVLDVALSTPTTVPLILLRHAQAMKRAAWAKSEDPSAGVDHERPLNEDGEGQLSLISDLLAAYGITAVHSSDARRCLQTVELFAQRHGLFIEHEPELSEEGFDEDPVAAEHRIEELLVTTAPIVVCTHRPLLPDLLRALAGAAEDVDPTDPMFDPVLPPGGAIVIHRDAARPQRIVAIERHLPPDA